MYDFSKPDLFIHPHYHKTVKYNFDLNRMFNVLSLSDLQAEKVVAAYLTDDELHPVSVTIDPVYSHRLIRESGGDSARTSYWFDKPTPMYRLNYTGPRYVIWTMNDNLTICATRADRVEPYQLYLAVQRAKEWAYDIEASKKVIVFDLDDTLINANNECLEDAHELLAHARRLYDYVVLWSHGSPLHVDDQLSKFDIKLFDLVLRNNDGNQVNKNLLHLYNYFPSCRFDNAKLVDDTVCNWTPEYTNMIIPSRDIKSLRAAKRAL